VELSKKDYKRYFEALQLAAQSECRYKIGAVLYRGKTRISAAHNCKKTHTDHKAWQSFVNSIHAEHYALLRARTFVDGSTMYIARAGGKRGTSKPCYMCRGYLFSAGVRYIVYTDNHKLIKEKL
jgi:tRNA(Arg) A34 adenosine deaminase TadA